MDNEEDKEFVEYIKRQHANADLPILLKKLHELKKYYAEERNDPQVISNTNALIHVNGKESAFDELIDSIEGVIDPTE